MKLFVYKTFKCDAIKVEVFNRDLPLNNSALLAK